MFLNCCYLDFSHGFLASFLTVRQLDAFDSVMAAVKQVACLKNHTKTASAKILKRFEFRQIA